MANIGIDLETGKPILITGNGGGGGGGGSATEVALLSVTTAPASPFAVGSKYYNSSTKKIVTAVTADTWTGATSADPVFNVIYTYDSGYYQWDGDTLESTDLNLYEKVANKSNSYTLSSETTYASTKALVDGLASVGSSSKIPFSIKSCNKDSRGLSDLVTFSEISNKGCSVAGAVVTGGSGKYLQLAKVVPINTANAWEIKTKYTHSTGGGTQGPSLFGYSGLKDFQNPTILIQEDIMILLSSSDGLTWNLFAGTPLNLTLTVGNTYYFKLSYDSVNGYKFEHSSDGISYTTSWSDATTTKSVCNTPYMFLNLGLNTENYYNEGSIDLSETRIVIDSVVWFSYSNTLTFKVDDGTLYQPLVIVSADGTETTINSLTSIDVSSLSNGVINVFANASGAVAYNNNIFCQIDEPTPIATNDIWFNNVNEAKKWSGTEWEITDLVCIARLFKDSILELCQSIPASYNGVGEMLVDSYSSGTEYYNLYIKPNFIFFVVQGGLSEETSASIGVTLMIAMNPEFNMFVTPKGSNAGSCSAENITNGYIYLFASPSSQLFWEVKGRRI